MDVEMLEELTVPSSGATTNESVIPTDLECQVETMEMVTPVTEEEEPVGAAFHRNQDCQDPKGELCNDQHKNSGSVGKVGGDRTGSD